ncbi:MAG TPA: diapophytoene dehydrogenase, partial [Flavobacteriaceae bacterium]|nr:diapophytoene dehydrogenase [Flavobacteriaceae bacterium]
VDNYEIKEMSRMEKLISDHMISSKDKSVHVQSFIEADITNLWEWRENNKEKFQKKEGEKITFTPIFIMLVAKALREFPLLNVSVDKYNIIKKKNINIGMATALNDGNLIVPVIKNADQLSLLGLAKKVNDLAYRARVGQLEPDEVQGGTYTISNIGVFDTLMGTPIINQPQVGNLAFGAIIKKPSVIETDKGDFIGIRHKIILSHSFDHRVVNGARGGLFIKRIKDLIENWETDLTV